MSDTETGITDTPTDADLAQILAALGPRVESVIITTRAGDMERVVRVTVRPVEGGL